MTSSLRRLALLLLLVATLVVAHEHMDEEASWANDNNFTNEEEIDETLKWHIGIQTVVWGLLFPIGMVLGINKSRWHVPLQTFGCVMTLAGNYLGHHHAGRTFHSTAHGYFASYIKYYLWLQIIFGIFLKLHVLEGTFFRRVIVTSHGVVGKSFPVVGWTQMIFGGIAALGFCFGDHLGQCLAHFIMGSSFIAYAMIMLLMVRVGAGFLLRHQVSQELLDSSVIMVWGIINTFTEHDFFEASGYWSHMDMQHTSLGVLWWCGGALGIFLGLNGKRNIVPGIIIAMTGFAMAEHGQSLEFSATIHKLFGYTLMGAGATRIIEICFVLNDAPSPAVTASTGPRAFQHLPPFLLVLGGLTFLSATEEQMQWVSSSGMDPVTYANILFSTSFIIYLFGAGLLELYERTRIDDSKPRLVEEDLERGEQRSWFGIPLPTYVQAMLSSGGSERSTREHYEAVPLTATPSNRSSGTSDEVPQERVMQNSTVFDVGDEEEDAREDSYWEEREKVSTHV